MEPLDTGGDTLRIGCTELKAVPHAGLGYQFLRVQVRKPEKEVEVHQVQRGPSSSAWPSTLNSKGTVERPSDRVTSSETKALCVTAESKPVQRLDFLF